MKKWQNQFKKNNFAKANLNSLNQSPILRIVAWEVTRRCNLSCTHCRAGALDTYYANELTTVQGKSLLTELRSLGQPIVILTGGEPLLRSDIFDLANFGSKLGLRIVMATNGTLLTSEVSSNLINSGVVRLSISIDGPTAVKHDTFRGQLGLFDKALAGIKNAQKIKLPYQINTTITRANLDLIENIYQLVQELEAIAFHTFLLVPTGRGRGLINEIGTSQEYEKILLWLAQKKLANIPIEIKVTCAPYFYRILREEAKRNKINLSFKKHGFDAVTKGCLGGQNFVFINHVGDVQPCGYLELSAGNVKKQSLTSIWYNSIQLKQLRNVSLLRGKCGICEYREICSGCRARAFESSGDELAEDPLCNYIPKYYKNS